MLYIIVALKAEAQAFVDKYRLQKQIIDNLTIFTNTNIRLLISGMGVENARVATQALINQFDIIDEDIYLNIGICAAPNNHNIGNLIEVGSIKYLDILYSFKRTKSSILCVDEALSSQIDEIVDMESYGFYDAIIHNPAIKNFFILKVVSDHFEPEKVSKEGAKKLLFDKIDDINTLIFSKD